MKLRNKKTGEICDFKIIADYDDCTSGWRLEKHNGAVLFYDHIDEIHEDWEYYEEPKEYWYIDCDGGILCGESDNSSAEKMMISMGNHFGTIKEAEKAVEKLKAWKRLKDKGLKFSLWQRRSDWARLPEVTALKHLVDIVAYTPDITSDIAKDLDLLFGGEE